MVTRAQDRTRQIPASSFDNIHLQTIVSISEGTLKKTLVEARRRERSRRRLTPTHPPLKHRIDQTLFVIVNLYVR